MKKTLPRNNINGILLVNKPKGLTSNNCLQKIKWIYQAKKAGHTGSLDPLATGMLPICFGEATKFSQYLLDSDKSYEARGQLGIKTNTGDALGIVIERNTDFKVTEQTLLNTISKFLGTIQQTPSSFSALKYQGKPLYEYARKGIAVPAKSRKITIHSITLKAFDGIFFDILVHCSKGTYIRNLVEDIGDFLGVGAHITRLHRVSIEGFEGQKMHVLEDVNRKPVDELENCLLPSEYSLSAFPAIHLSCNDAVALRCGQKISYQSSELTSFVSVIPHTDSSSYSLDKSKNKQKNKLEESFTTTENLIRLYRKVDSQFIGLGLIDSSNIIRAKRLLC